MDIKKQFGWKKVLFLSGVLVTLLSFQNCSNVGPSSDPSSAASTAAPSDLADNLPDNGDLVVGHSITRVMKANSKISVPECLSQSSSIVTVSCEKVSDLELKVTIKGHAAGASKIRVRSGPGTSAWRESTVTVHTARHYPLNESPGEVRVIAESGHLLKVASTGIVLHDLFSSVDVPVRLLDSPYIDFMTKGNEYATHAVSSNGRFIVFADAQKISLYDIVTSITYNLGSSVSGYPLLSISSFNNRIRIFFTEDSKKVVYSTRPGSLKVFDLSTFNSSEIGIGIGTDLKAVVGSKHMLLGQIQGPFPVAIGQPNYDIKLQLHDLASGANVGGDYNPFGAHNFDGRQIYFPEDGSNAFMFREVFYNHQCPTSSAFCNTAHSFPRFKRVDLTSLTALPAHIDALPKLFQAKGTIDRSTNDNRLAGYVCNAVNGTSGSLFCSELNVGRFNYSIYQESIN